MPVVFTFPSITSVALMSKCREVIAQMVNEANANKVIAAILKTARVGKSANTEKFYFHNSLLPSKEQKTCS